VNAKCQTINHNPICTCKAGFTGDPFVVCQLEQSKDFVTKLNKIIVKLKVLFLMQYFHIYFVFYYSTFHILISFIIILYLFLIYRVFFFSLRNYYYGT
jgi:hypothetical protein